MLSCFRPINSNTEYINMLDIIVRSLPIPCVVTTQNGIMIQANVLLCDLFGYCFGELLGEHINLLFPSHNPLEHYIGKRHRVKGLHRYGTLLNTYIYVSTIKYGNTTKYVATVEDEDITYPSINTHTARSSL